MTGSPVSPLEIRILFRHPTLDPSTITMSLGMQPNSQARVGDIVTTPKGEVLSGTYADTAWSLWRSYKGEPDINASLREFLEPFEQRADAVRDIASGGRAAEVIVSFPGQLYFGGAISADVLRIIACLGLDLGIEVFPDSAT